MGQLRWKTVNWDSGSSKSKKRTRIEGGQDNAASDDRRALRSLESGSKRPQRASAAPTASGSTISSAEGATDASASAPEQKRAFPAAAEIPTQIGPHGIDSISTTVAACSCPRASALARSSCPTSTPQHPVRDHAQGRAHQQHQALFPACRGSRCGAARVGPQSRYNAKDQEVAVQLPVGAIGDTLGWFPYAVKFQRVHGCKLTVVMAEFLIPLFAKAYPEINFIVQEAVKPGAITRPTISACFSTTKIAVFQPADFRLVGLHRTAGYILGIDPKEGRPRSSSRTSRGRSPNPMSASRCKAPPRPKYWNSPTGWREISRSSRMRATMSSASIAADARHRRGLEPHSLWRRGPNRQPAADRAGALAEACRFLRRPVVGTVMAGLASGTKVLMISGFSGDERVRNALSGHQLPRLQLVLE